MSVDQINKNQIVISKVNNEDGSEETEEWQGFVQTMKKFLRRNLSVTNAKAADIEKKVLDLDRMI